jgi:hypothetical protein
MTVKTVGQVRKSRETSSVDTGVEEGIGRSTVEDY